jgi:NitT/TauT family transport system ATP-binding protein
MRALTAELLAARPVRALIVTHAREDALALADRVVTLGGSPAGIVSETRLDRPRAARDADWIAEAARRLPGPAAA